MMAGISVSGSANLAEVEKIGVGADVLALVMVRTKPRTAIVALF
jgi:hypothetical protein